MLKKVLSIQENGVRKYLTTNDNYQTLSYSTNPNDGLVFDIEPFFQNHESGTYYSQNNIDEDNYTTHVAVSTNAGSHHVLLNHDLSFEYFYDYIYWGYTMINDSHRLVDNVFNHNISLLVDFHDPNNLPAPPTVCLLEGTKVLTDQGPVIIEELTRDNTIFGCYINNVTKSQNHFNYLIHFKPNSILDNVPSKDIYCTPNHAIYCPISKKLKLAKEFCDGNNILEDYTKDVSCNIYNVIVQDDHGNPSSHAMYVNNMLCESLHPTAYDSVRHQLLFS